MTLQIWLSLLQRLLLFGSQCETRPHPAWILLLCCLALYKHQDWALPASCSSPTARSCWPHLHHQQQCPAKNHYRHCWRVGSSNEQSKIASSAPNTCRYSSAFTPIKVALKESKVSSSLYTLVLLQAFCFFSVRTQVCTHSHHWAFV